jgi:hypothetical protein
MFVLAQRKEHRGRGGAAFRPSSFHKKSALIHFDLLCFTLIHYDFVGLGLDPWQGVRASFAKAA